MTGNTKTQVVGKRPGLFRRLVGYTMVALGCFAAAFAVVSSARADDISDTITSVSGYETAAVAVGIAILLFVIGRKVVRRLIAFALLLGAAGYASMAHATDPTDIGGVITAVGGYQTAAVAVGIAILLFVIGRKVVRRLI